MNLYVTLKQNGQKSYLMLLTNISTRCWERTFDAVKGTVKQ